MAADCEATSTSASTASSAASDKHEHTEEVVTNAKSAVCDEYGEEPALARAQVAPRIVPNPSARLCCGCSARALQQHGLGP
jgi:hypothetical protein